MSSVTSAAMWSVDRIFVRFVVRVAERTDVSSSQRDAKRVGAMKEVHITFDHAIFDGWVQSRWKRGRIWHVEIWSGSVETPYHP